MQNGNTKKIQGTTSGEGKVTKNSTITPGQVATANPLGSPTSVGVVVSGSSGNVALKAKPEAKPTVLDIDYKEYYQLGVSEALFEYKNYLKKHNFFDDKDDFKFFNFSSLALGLICIAFEQALAVPVVTILVLNELIFKNLLKNSFSTLKDNAKYIIKNDNNEVLLESIDKIVNDTLANRTTAKDNKNFKDIILEGKDNATKVMHYLMVNRLYNNEYSFIGDDKKFSNKLLYESIFKEKESDFKFDAEHISRKWSEIKDYILIQNMIANKAYEHNAENIVSCLGAFAVISVVINKSKDYYSVASTLSELYKNITNCDGLELASDSGENINRTLSGAENMIEAIE